jgi:polyisoprenyl-teichoic acid--peptidoglycan teichoic acid transferase
VEARKVNQQRRKTGRSSNKSYSSTARRKPSKRQRRRGFPLWLTLGLGGVGVFSAAAGALLAFTFTAAPLQQKILSAEDAAFFNQNGKEVFSRNLLQIPEVTRPVNILFLGIKTNLSDLKTTDGSQRKRTGYDKEVNSLEGLSDTMMLLRFDPVNQRVVVMGIPRDTKIQTPDGRDEKINAVDRERGVGAAAQEVSKVLQGVPIDRYIRLNSQGVEKLIDALGGVTVTVPKDIKYQDDSQHFYINLKAGRQHLDGQKLLGYMRFRNDANGDIGRMQRQQTVIQAFTQQVLNPMTVARIPDLYATLKEHLDTNLTVEEILALGGFSLHTGKSKMQTLMLPGDYNGDGKRGTSYWLSDEKGIQNLMARYFDRGNLNLEQSRPSNIRINIQDTSYFPDATDRLVRRLSKAGYSNISIDKNVKIKEDLATTQIIAQKGDPQVAQGIALVLGGIGDVRVDTSGQLYTDVTIKLGRDWVQREKNYSSSQQK